MGVEETKILKLREVQMLVLYKTNIDGFPLSKNIAILMRNLPKAQ